MIFREMWLIISEWINNALYACNQLNQLKINEVKIVINWSLIIEFIIQEISSVRFNSRRSISLSSTFSITRHIRQTLRTSSLSNSFAISTEASVYGYSRSLQTLPYVKYIIELSYAIYIMRYLVPLHWQTIICIRSWHIMTIVTCTYYIVYRQTDSQLKEYGLWIDNAF